MTSMPLTELKMGQFGKVVGLQGGIRFIQRMNEEGIRVDITLQRVGKVEFEGRPQSTFRERVPGRNRGRSKGKGLGINQFFVEVNGNVVNLGVGEAMNIFVETKEKVQQPQFKFNPA